MKFLIGFWSMQLKNFGMIHLVWSLAPFGVGYDMGNIYLGVWGLQE